MMKGSGLEEALKTVYHMMSGKAISRALHGHSLITAVLSAKLQLNKQGNDIILL